MCRLHIFTSFIHMLRLVYTTHKYTCMNVSHFAQMLKLSLKSKAVITNSPSWEKETKQRYSYWHRINDFPSARSTHYSYKMKNILPIFLAHPESLWLITGSFQILAILTQHQWCCTIDVIGPQMQFNIVFYFICSPSNSILASILNLFDIFKPCWMWISFGKIGFVFPCAQKKFVKLIYLS